MHTRSRAGMLSLCALFAALLAVCSQIQIPLPGVPMNMALFAVHLCAMLLGPRAAFASVLSYLLLGTFGVPVFSGFTSGPAALLGQTGGFLLGYLLCAPLEGALCRRMPRFAAALIGLGVCMLCGWAHFLLITGLSPDLRFFAGCLLFLPGDLIKIALASLLAGRLIGPLRSMGCLPSFPS